ncbi:MAG TPA: ABC transporter ATP-binding protein [Chthoniobacteraceae bacterium]|jgi:ABC-2 type transport system ATP-binding protein
MITARSLTKRFGSLTAVDQLDLDVGAGEFFAFLGPNAAGKTTTIKMLTGLLRPTAGTVQIGGFDVQLEPEKAKAQLAYVPDFPFLYDKLTCLEFMRFVGDIFRLDLPTIRRETEELFEKFHLMEYTHELTENLSHGTKQRLVIASALLHSPKILVIDEPMVGLDPRHARVVKNEFKERARAGMTIFLSTHQLSVAEELADRIGIINRGKLIALGTVEELRAQSPEGGALEKVFLSLVDAEDAIHERLKASAK